MVLIPPSPFFRPGVVLPCISYLSVWSSGIRNAFTRRGVLSSPEPLASIPCFPFLFLGTLPCDLLGLFFQAPPSSDVCKRKVGRPVCVHNGSMIRAFLIQKDFFLFFSPPLPSIVPLPTANSRPLFLKSEFFRLSGPPCR